MKLNPKNIFPTKDGIYFALNNIGFVGICEFKDGKWCESIDFQWISFNQPERLSEKTSDEEDAIV